MSKRAAPEPQEPTPKREKLDETVATDEEPASPSEVKGEPASPSSPQIPLDTGLELLFGKAKYAFDPTNLIVGTPRQLRNSKKADISYRLTLANGTTKDVSPVILQTPVLKTTFGFSTYRHVGGDRIKLSLDARFSDPDSAVLATLRATDAHLVKVIKSRLDEFVSAKKRSPEMVNLMYNDLVRSNEKDGVVYDPSVSFKIASSEEGGLVQARIKVFTADSTSGSFQEIEVGEIGKGATYRGVVSVEGIYVTPQSLTPKLRIDQAQKLSDGTATGFAFVDGPATVVNA